MKLVYFWTGDLCNLIEGAIQVKVMCKMGVFGGWQGFLQDGVRHQSCQWDVVWQSGKCLQYSLFIYVAKVLKKKCDLIEFYI